MIPRDVAPGTLQYGASGEFFGWINDQRKVEAVLATLPMPLFEDAAPHLKGTGEDKDIILPVAFRKATGLKDLPQGPQKIGDCVSWGWTAAIDLVQGTQILLGKNEEYQESCSEAMYGLSRVQVGGERGSYQDGSVGAWAAKAANLYGYLSRKISGPYDPNRAKKWGAQGLPDEYLGECKKHTAATVSLVTDFEQARDAIANGYPVPVCSDQGFSMSRDKDGFCRPQGSWAHCMCFAGVKSGGRPGLLCLQSWGANVLDQPDNSFFVDAEVATRMLKQRDSFTLSGFTGYPGQDILNWLH
jgi:hypothetical protein